MHPSYLTLSIPDLVSNATSSRRMLLLLCKVSLLWCSGLTAQIMDDYINVVLLVCERFDVELWLSEHEFYSSRMTSCVL